MGWVRMGACIQCGRCCRLNNLLGAPVHSGSSVNVSEAKCKHLIELDDGTAICGLFGKPERPQACIDHPSSPLSLIEGCGFCFIFVNEGDSICM